METRRLFAAGLLFDAVGLTATESVDIDGTSYFFADDGTHGRELRATGCLAAPLRSRT